MRAPSRIVRDFLDRTPHTGGQAGALPHTPLTCSISAAASPSATWAAAHTRATTRIWTRRRWTTRSFTRSWACRRQAVDARARPTRQTAVAAVRVTGCAWVDGLAGGHQESVQRPGQDAPPRQGRRRGEGEFPRGWHAAAAPSQSGCAVQFKEIQKAYEILSDPEKRANYDKFGEGDGPRGGGEVRCPHDPTACPCRLVASLAVGPLSRRRAGCG
jgi:hypothetical protein